MAIEAVHACTILNVDKTDYRNFGEGEVDVRGREQG